MVGLIYKDLCCLKKHIKVFILVTLATIVLSVLFILSIKYGNVALMIAEMSEEEFFGMFQTAIWCVLILPIVSSAMIQECFNEDTKVNFKKCLYALPVKEENVVGGRYVSGLAFLFLGFLGTLVASICICFATDAFKFTQLLSYCITVLAALIVYEAFVMFVLYTVDGKKADLIQCIPLVALFFGIGYLFVNKISDMTNEQFMEFSMNTMNKAKDLMMKYCILVLLGALLIMGISYVGSVLVQKKRGLG